MAPDASAPVLTDFKLPSLGSDMDHGTVIRWLVEVGDTVRKGDVLLEVDTEKSDIEVEVWHDAVVAQIIVGAGSDVPVGTVLARLAEPDTEVSALTTLSPPVVPAAGEAEPEPAAPGPSTPSPPSPPERPRPVTVGAVAAALRPTPTPRMVFWPPEAASAEPAAPDASRAPQSEASTRSRSERRQDAVATSMERANREIPHFHLTREIDVTEVMTWLNARNAERPPTERVLPAALLLHGTARAVAKHRVLNGWSDGQPTPEHVDLGVAVHMRGGGLMTPTLPAAETLSLDELMDGLRAMVGRAHGGKLSTGDATPSTITVTNLGDAGADAVWGVIRPPQLGLIGFGTVAERPAVVDGEIAIRRMVTATLTADHRSVNGEAGAGFLATLSSELSTPPEDIHD